MKRSTWQFLNPSRQLYDWLIRPLHPILDGRKIDTLVFVPGGCLKGQLKTPVEDHRVQASTIAEGCSTDAYAESKCSKQLQEDLDAMAKQACLLDAIVKGQKPEACEASK